MDRAYPGHGIISRSHRKLFEAWNKLDPVDDWERERARRIEAIQGNRHAFVWAAGQPIASPAEGSIIGNRNSKVYHRPDCPSYGKVSPQNSVRSVCARWCGDAQHVPSRGSLSPAQDAATAGEEDCKTPWRIFSPCLIGTRGGVLKASRVRPPAAASSPRARAKTFTTCWLRCSGGFRRSLRRRRCRRPRRCETHWGHRKANTRCRASPWPYRTYNTAIFSVVVCSAIKSAMVFCAC